MYLGLETSVFNLPLLKLVNPSKYGGLKCNPDICDNNKNHLSVRNVVCIIVK